MKNRINQIINQIQKDKLRRRRMGAALLVLSIFVMSGVLWQLKITGITMTGEALCGKLAHQHTADCVKTVEVCGLEESEGHQHDETDCYRTLICTKAVHVHDDACYTKADAPVCGLEEAEGHRHTETCRKQVYVCEYKEEHIHSLLCYSNADADLETSDDWEKTLPTLTQDPAKDLAAVSRSQVGYAESVQNYKVSEDGTTKLGYTRYGEWYGNPYGNWSAMFVSFCLNYAEHPAYEALKNSGVEAMRLAAEQAGVYYAASVAAPGVGDLAFLDKDGNGTCEAVAIVAELNEDGICLVEGDCDGAVAENEYAPDDGAILGYAVLTAQPAAAYETDTDDNVTEEDQKEEDLLTDESGITLTFVINNTNYTYDPGDAHTTHITVDTTDGLAADGGLIYTEWSGQSQYMVTGEGTLDSFTIPSGGSLSGSGYALPKINVINMSPETGRQYTYASAYSWVTGSGMICNEKTVFTEDTTLYLSLYESGTTCNLNWVCNCDSDNDGNPDGTHSITSVVSGFGSASFTWNQSVSEPYIPTAAAVNSMYTGSAWCAAGPDHSMEFTGWYVKDASGNEIDFTAGMPIREDYKDPNSDGYSVKVYARWQEVATSVTATFINGETKTTVTLTGGEALGSNLPAVEAPDGMSFLGWKIGETSDYADATTVIEEDTTYTAVFAKNVTVTFKNNGEQFGEAVTVPEGTLLWEYLPDEEPEYTGDSENVMVFVGWKIGDTTDMVAENTAAEEGMIMHAVFEEEICYDVYLHDIAPDGVTDYELDGQDVEISQIYLVEGTTLAQWLEEEPYAMLHDDAPASECKWYTRQETDGAVTYVPYILDTEITSELHLYTFNYSVTMTRTEAAATASFLNLFPVASAAEITVSDDGNTLTLILREGEKPTAADFVVNGVDYSVYNWNFTDGDGNALQDMTIAYILANGVEENITATSDGTLAISAESKTQHIYFYAIVDNQKKLVAEENLTVYKFDGVDRYRISETVLEDIYKDYGLDVTDADQYKFAFNSAGEDEDLWNDVALHQENGKQFVALEGSVEKAVYFYYLPAVTEPTSTGDTADRHNWTHYQTTNSFYSVTVSDPTQLIYQDAAEIPAVQYVFTGGNATVTVPVGTDITWTYTEQGSGDDQAYESVAENKNEDDGTVTYTFTKVTAPITLTPVEVVPVNHTVSVVDLEGLVYQSESEIPADQQVLEGETATVTVMVPAQNNVVWTYTAQGEGENRIYESVSDTDNGDGTVTYTFTNVSGSIVLTPVYANLTTANKTVNFYVYVDNTKVLVESGNYTVYANGNKHWLSASMLEQVYGDYGFTADQLNTDSRYFPHTDAGSSTVWTDEGPVQLNGVWFSPILNSTDPDNCDVYYAPGYTAKDSANITTLANNYSFYMVTVTDPDNRVYGADEDLPEAQIVFDGTSAAVTVKTPGQAYYWAANGEELTGGVTNDDGTVTYTIRNITEPIVVTPRNNIITIQVQDDNHLIYADGASLPSVIAVRGSSAEITVNVKDGYGWLANGNGIPGGGVYSDDRSQITYTFDKVTEDITLTPIAVLSSVTINYDINIDINKYGTPTSTAPTVKDSEDHGSDDGDYVVLTPSRTQYTVQGTNSLYAVVFQGWEIEDWDIRLQAGEVLTVEDLSKYGPTINLKAVWYRRDQTHSVTFYINLELLTERYDNTTNNSITNADATPNGNYTTSMFGTEVSIDECPQCDDGRAFQEVDVIPKPPEGTESVVTQTLAELDTQIRDLPHGVTAEYMQEDRLFTLGTFPDDRLMMEKIAQKQQDMINDFVNNTDEKFHVEDDPTNVTAYRAEGTYSDGVFHPTYRIICARDTDGQLRYIPAEELNTQNYTIRWYVFKYQNNGWHIDGVLVKKQGQMTITKTFYGDDAAVEAVKKGYTIDVLGINEENPDSMEGRPHLYTLTLNPKSQDNSTTNGVITQGYSDHDPTTDTYTWVISLTADWKAWLYERNYIHTGTDNSIVTLSEYSTYNFTEATYNQKRAVYSDNDGVLVAAKAHGLDEDYKTFETASFYNTYLPSAAVPISKVDDNGNPLPGVSFSLTGMTKDADGKDATVPAKIWKDNAGVYHYRPNSVQEGVDDSWAQVNVITVDDSGYALVMGLKDNALNYSFELVETSTPEGYNSIGIPIGFTISGDGSIQLNAGASDSGMVTTPNQNTIRVTNTSQLMSVTAVKNWSDGANEKVTLQLMLDDVALSGKVVELDGTVDTPAADQTDGYESAPWTVTWNNLPAYTGSTKAEYTVKEIKIGNTDYDATGTYGDGYADYHVVVGDMQYTAYNGTVPTAATINVTNRKQLAGLEFTKTDEVGSALEGATFQLYSDAACTKTYGASQTSNENGEVAFGSLAAGTYYMKETAAPNNYQISDMVYTVTVHAGKTNITVYGSTTPITTIVNDSTPATLQLQKVDGDGNNLSGAVFEVLKKNSLTGEYDEKVTQTVDGNEVNQFAVDADGKLEITGLTRGSYKLAELSAPDGYYRMTEEIFFTVEKGAVKCDGKSLNWSFDGTTFTVKNVSGSELPQTGGMGTHYGTMAGLLMMASSLLYGFLLRRKRERGGV